MTQTASLMMPPLPASRRAERAAECHLLALRASKCSNDCTCCVAPIAWRWQYQCRGERVTATVDGGVGRLMRATLIDRRAVDELAPSLMKRPLDDDGRRGAHRKAEGGVVDGNASDGSREANRLN